MKKAIIITTAILLSVSTIIFGQNPRELTERRTYYSKTFYNEENNVYTTKISSNLVHYKDENGNYLPIETNIVPSTNAGYNYEVNKGVYKAYFKSDISSAYPVKFESRNGFNFQIQPYAIGYIDLSTRSKRVLAQVQSNQPQVINNEITYPSIFPGVDLKYKYMEKKLKEEIILTTQFRNNLPPPSQFGFNNNSTILVILNKIDFSKNLELEEQDSSGVSNHLALSSFDDYTTGKRLKFKIRNKLQYTLPIDVAYLQNEDSTAASNVVPLKRRIRKINGELVLLTGIKYNNLMQFPAGNVVLDPTVETEFVATHDTWLENTSVKGTQQLLILGKAAGYPKKRSVLRFDLANIPTNAEINSSNLNVYYYGVARGGGAPGSFIERDIKANVVYTSWNESSATRDYPWHASYGLFGTSPVEADYYYTEEDVVHFSDTTQVWKTFDLTNATQQWVDGSLDNQGVVLWATNENTDGYDMRMWSSEYSADTTYRPYLEVSYTRQFVKNYYLKDHLGNIRVTIDKDGDVVGYDDYYPFGLQMPGRTYNLGLTNDIYKFSGKELDTENSLDWYYFGARYYDPAIGRFLSVDPLADRTPSWTPYRYAFNNPLRFIDPLGMTEEERDKAVETANKYVEKNPNRDSKLYDPTGEGIPGSKGKPGEATDCSGLASGCVTSSGVENPNSGNSNGVSNIVNNTESVSNNNVQEGNLASFNNGKSGKEAKSNTHIGIVTGVNKDKNGNVTSVEMVHSGQSTGPVKSTVRMDGTGYYGKRFQGFHKWDSPDKPKTATTVRATPNTANKRTGSAVPSFIQILKRY